MAVTELSGGNKDTVTHWLVDEEDFQIASLPLIQV